MLGGRGKASAGENQPRPAEREREREERPGVVGRRWWLRAARLIGFIRLIDYCPLMRKTLARKVGGQIRSTAALPGCVCDDVPGGCNFWLFRAGQREILAI